MLSPETFGRVPASSLVIDPRGATKLICAVVLVTLSFRGLVRSLWARKMREYGDANRATLQKQGSASHRGCTWHRAGYCSSFCKLGLAGHRECCTRPGH